MFCGLSLHYDSTIRLLIVNNIVIVTSDFNVKFDLLVLIVFKIINTNKILSL